jgi:predicted phosphodiesterase
MTLLLSLLGCDMAECSRPAFQHPECRVQAENEHARLVTYGGVDVRFQHPDAQEMGGWDARGVLRAGEDGVVHARVATLGDFLLTLEADAPQDVRVMVDNVHPLIEPLEGQVEAIGLRRVLELSLMPGITEIPGLLPESVCDAGFVVAAGGDIQTNPQQYKRIVEDLHDEALWADEQGTPLLGMLLLGDLSEFNLAAELEEVLDMASQAPVPTAAVPGNHDVYNNLDAVYNRIIGPGNYSFDLCGARFVMLDTGSGWIAPSVQGRLPELMDHDGEFLVAGMHHPPIPGRTSGGWTDETQAAHIMAEMGARDADLIVTGHLHKRKRVEAGPVPQIVVGTLGASQGDVQPDYGYLRMTFVDQLDTCFVPVPAPGVAPPSRTPPEDCPVRE